MVVASVNLTGAVQVVCLAGGGVCGCFLVSSRWGVGTYLECVCMHLGGFFLEKIPISCK
jgi:hypothetical protein